MKHRSGYVYRDKAAKCWIARTTITDDNGRRRNVKRRAKNKSEARTLLKSLIRTIDDEGNRAIKSARMTFNQLADYYEDNYVKPAEFADGRKVAGLRDWKHNQAYCRTLRRYFGNRRLREITYGEISALRSQRLKTITQYGRQRSVTTVNRELSCLRSMLNVALRESWITKNPFNLGEPLIAISAERRREKILSVSEEMRLLDACDSHPSRKRLKSLLIFLIDTGCRKSEALRLRWNSVCFVSRTITIEGATTKTLKARQVMMTERVFHELSSLRAKSIQAQGGSVFGINDNVRKSFVSACKLAGIKHGGIDGLTLHGLRHTAATRLVQGGLSLQLAGRILGHSQVSTTYRYVSANSDTIAQAAAILEKAQSDFDGEHTSPEGRLLN